LIAQQPDQPPPTLLSSPPAFTAATFAEAEKLVQVETTDAAGVVSASNWRMQMARVDELRVGPGKLVLEPTVAPLGWR
jgi:hypothetical protein